MEEPRLTSDFLDRIVKSFYVLFPEVELLPFMPVAVPAAKSSMNGVQGSEAEAEAAPGQGLRSIWANKYRGVCARFSGLSRDYDFMCLTGC